jgi:indolepyruvate ferredoxin oxidoreductase beta subunit
VPAEPAIVSVLIPAVGGQGGGVLSEWIVDAALDHGLRVHGTSIPGVAQRTGSTTYYIELYDAPEAEEPAFSLYPVPGALDVLVAPEFLEVGRMIELGFVSPLRTTVIASTVAPLSFARATAVATISSPMSPSFIGTRMRLNDAPTGSAFRGSTSSNTPFRSCHRVAP